MISRFRAADVLTVAADGTVLEPATLPVFQLFGQEFKPSVAWRMVQMPGGGVAIVHQRAMTTTVEIKDDGYSEGGCDGSIVHGAVSTLGAPTSSTLASAAIPRTVLPVDLAISSDGQKIAVIAAGTGELILTNQWLIQGSGFEGEGTCNEGEQRAPVAGEPIAVGFVGTTVVMQTREPATISILGGATIELPGESVADTGHQMFHSNPGGTSALACASCHPGGRDDGQTWNFNPIGERRTQFISGGILNTAPFHWDGDMKGLDTIMGEVFERRMGGVHQSPRRVHAFEMWIDKLPALPVSPPEDPEAVTRGQQAFAEACAGCHAGSALTDNKSVDVGTGKAFQVPSLAGIAHRAPFMHNGCAATLKDRFTNPACGGGDLHTKRALSPTEVDDLVAYLETL
jgi:mono/diheme cytochrome c family protein